jgi:hypothetical protein
MRMMGIEGIGGIGGSIVELVFFSIYIAIQTGTDHCLASASDMKADWEEWSKSG